MGLTTGPESGHVVKNMQHRLLAKGAESGGLRKGYSQELDMSWYGTAILSPIHCLSLILFYMG